MGRRSSTVEFSSYSRGPGGADLLSVILQASEDAAIHVLQGNGDKAIGRSLTYTANRVSLTFSPNDSLVWSTWGLFVTALRAPFSYEFVGYHFTVNEAWRPVGTGYLGVVPRVNPIASSVAAPVATPEPAIQPESA